MAAPYPNTNTQSESIFDAGSSHDWRHIGWMVSPTESILARVNVEVLLSPNNLTHLHTVEPCGT